MTAVIARQIDALSKAGETKDATDFTSIDPISMARQDFMLGKVTLHQHTLPEVICKIIKNSQHLPPGCEQHQRTLFFGKYVRDQCDQLLRVRICIARTGCHLRNLQNRLLLEAEWTGQTQERLPGIDTGFRLINGKIPTHRNRS